MPLNSPCGHIAYCREFAAFCRLWTSVCLNREIKMNQTFISSLILVLLGGVLNAAETHLQFTARASHVNDATHQATEMVLAAERSIRHQNQIVATSQQKMHRSQDRVVTILKTAEGKPIQARIDYGDSTTRVEASEQRNVKVIQPIAHKTYFVTRDGDQLLFANETGKQITEEEDKLLQQQFQNFGKPNPLAEFLDGKRISIGQSIDVPEDVARELLGLTGHDGKTDRLSLRLVDRKAVAESECGVFETILRTSSDETSMSLLMKGQIVVDPATCQTKAIRLQGPVAISETRGPTEGRFVVSTNGSLQVNLKSIPQSSIETASTNATQRR